MNDLKKLILKKYKELQRRAAKRGYDSAELPELEQSRLMRAAEHMVLATPEGQAAQAQAKLEDEQAERDGQFQRTLRRRRKLMAFQRDRSDDLD
jgi:hypothetical protein